MAGQQRWKPGGAQSLDQQLCPEQASTQGKLYFFQVLQQGKLCWETFMNFVNMAGICSGPKAVLIYTWKTLTHAILVISAPGNCTQQDKTYTVCINYTFVLLVQRCDSIHVSNSKLIPEHISVWKLSRPGVGEVWGIRNRKKEHKMRSSQVSGVKHFSWKKRGSVQMHRAYNSNKSPLKPMKNTEKAFKIK